MQAETLVAWQVRGIGASGESESAVFFLPDGVPATSEIAFDKTGIDGDQFQRAPELDQYAPGPVSAEVLLKAGWWFSCSYCEKRVTEDGPDDDGEGDRPPGPPVVLKNDNVYCDQRCLDAAREERKALEEKRAAMSAEALRRFPGVTVERTWDNGVELQVPGCLGIVSWYPEKPDEVFVQQRDVKAWKTYDSQRKEKRA